MLPSRTLTAGKQAQQTRFTSTTASNIGNYTFSQQDRKSNCSERLQHHFLYHNPHNNGPKQDAPLPQTRNSKRNPPSNSSLTYPTLQLLTTSGRTKPRLHNPPPHPHQQHQRWRWRAHLRQNAHRRQHRPPKHPQRQHRCCHGKPDLPNHVQVEDGDQTLSV
jgi:hypothetical protein